MRRALPTILLSLLMLLIHSTLVPFLAIRDVIPDILLIWIVILAVREGQITATIAGFALGLAQDLVGAGAGMIGLAALSKTVAGFVAGYFYNENKIQQTLGGYTFIVAVGIAALLQNVIYFIVYLQGSSLGLGSIMLEYGIPATLYTAAVGLLPMFAFARRYRT